MGHFRTWRTPIVLVAAGCAVAILSFGPRSTMGLILGPLTVDTGWQHSAFALAIALQHIVWGIAQPFGGMIADRFGTVRALCVGSLLYAAGLAFMGNANSQADLYWAGVLIGFGLAGASFNIVLGAFGQLLPEPWRPLGIGLGGAAGSFGQFLFSPLCVVAIDALGWRGTLLLYSGLVLLAVPVSFVFSAREPNRTEQQAAFSTQSPSQVFFDALRNPFYALLLAVFFGSGLHVAFINAHLPLYLHDQNLDATWIGWVIALVGLFNIFGSIASGWLCTHYPQRYLLFGICILRAAVVTIFLILPLTPTVALIFGAAMGLLWLSATPPVTGLIVAMFGIRNLAALFGVAYLVHQVGAFLGVWLGGLIYERVGSHEAMLWCLAVVGLTGAALSLPISEASEGGAVGQRSHK